MVLESLEDRRLLAVDIQINSAGALTIDDVNGDDEIRLSVDNANQTLLVNDTATTISADSVHRIDVWGRAGDDLIDLSWVDSVAFSNLTGGVTIFAGPGNDTGFDDLIRGGHGDDILEGLFGDDVLKGELGIDSLLGGFGDDRLSIGRHGKSPQGLPDVLFAETADATGPMITLRFDQVTNIDADALALFNQAGTIVDTSAASFDFDPASFTASWDLAGLGLPDDYYNFELYAASVTNLTGEALDGNHDGVSGDNFRGRFRVGSPQLTQSLGPQVLEMQANQGADSYADIDSISVSFDSDVGASVDLADLQLIDSFSNTSLSATSVAYDPFTNTATWSFAATVPAAYYTVQLDGTGLQDSTGNTLAGDFQVSGSDFRRALLVTLSGDINLNGEVEAADATTIISAVGTADATWEQGDIDGDATVTPMDALVGVNGIGGAVVGWATTIAEIMDGGFGNDTFELAGPAGSELVNIIDEEGIDTYDLSQMPRGVTNFDLRLASIQVTGGSASQLLVVNQTAGDIENVIGTPFADTIIGTDGPNEINAGAGDDTLEGLGGDDLVYGGKGNDRFVFTGTSDLGHDFLFERANEGNDTIDLSGLQGPLAYSAVTRNQVVTSLLSLTTDDWSGNPGAFELDPIDFDSDDDLLLDGFEYASNGILDPFVPNDIHADGDLDGLSNLREQILGTNAGLYDSDGDSTGDGLEVTQGSDPHDPGDFGAAPLLDRSIALELRIEDDHFS